MSNYYEKLDALIQATRTLADEQRTANMIALMQTAEFADIDGTWSITMGFRQELLEQITERLVRRPAGS